MICPQRLAACGWYSTGCNSAIALVATTPTACRQAQSGWATPEAATLPLVWHGPGEGADQLARLAASFQAANTGTRVPDRLDASLGFNHRVFGPCAKLRWYDAAVDRVWQAWLGREGVDGMEPRNSGSAWLFGADGVGKAVFRTFMAVSILQRRNSAPEPANRECLIVFDHSCCFLCHGTVLVRQRNVAGDAPLVEVAATRNSDVVRRAAAVAGCRVYHLLTSKAGRVTGHGLGAMYVQRRFTLLTSGPDAGLEVDLLRETRKATPVDVLYAPCSTRQEMHTLNKLKPNEEQLSDNRVNYIVDRYGAVPRRLGQCGDEERERKFVHDLAMHTSSVVQTLLSGRVCPLAFTDLERGFSKWIVREAPAAGAGRSVDLLARSSQHARWASPFLLRMVTSELFQYNMYRKSRAARLETVVTRAPNDVGRRLEEDYCDVRRQRAEHI